LLGSSRANWFGKKKMNYSANLGGAINERDADAGAE
jgi:hypothetical protein